MNEQTLVLAFAWYQPDEWAKLKQVVDDPTTLDDSYAEWRKNAEQSLSELTASGQRVMKIAIKIDDLLAWCDSNGLPPDSKSRSQYAALQARQREG